MTPTNFMVIDLLIGKLQRGEAESAPPGLTRFRKSPACLGLNLSVLQICDRNFLSSAVVCSLGLIPLTSGKRHVKFFSECIHVFKTFERENDRVEG